jgi:hypothetical protein
MERINVKSFANSFYSYSKVYSEFKDTHEEALEDMLRQLPSGSGLDSGVQFQWDESTAERLVFKCDFHHMDEHGMYDGWSEHRLIITPSLVYGFNMRITGRDRNGIKDYLTSLFYEVFE